MDRIYTKLIKGTHHDRISICPNPHKILGFLALGHYLVRYILVITTGSMYYSGTSYDLLFMAGHLLLSLSSFLFPISDSRNMSNQIIWRELQLHNIIFTSRSIAIFAYQLVWPEQHLWARFLIVMAFHAAADVVSHYYKEETTMRYMSWDNSLVPVSAKAYFDKFYALCQFGATTALIIPSATTFEHATMVMFSIQISTFLMTLRLKGLIGNDMWHIAYAISLLMNYHVAGVCGGGWILIPQLLFYALRVHLRLDKYVGWFLVIAMYNQFLQGQ